MKQIYLVRHCQATGQESDAPLTPSGKKQAEQLAEFFRDRPIDRILSSPFLRAVDTVTPLAEQRGLSIEQDERLVERVLSAQPMTDWYERLRATFDDLTLQYEGGESSRTAMDRVNFLLAEVLESEHRHILLVSHGCLLALLMKSIDDRIGFAEWEALSNPDVYQLTVADSSRQLHRIWK